MESIQTRMLEANVSSTLNVCIARILPSLMYKLICAKEAIGSFLADHKFKLCSFLLSFIRETGKTLRD